MSFVTYLCVDKTFLKNEIPVRVQKHEYLSVVISKTEESLHLLSVETTTLLESP